MANEEEDLLSQEEINRLSGNDSDKKSDVFVDIDTMTERERNNYLPKWFTSHPEFQPKAQDPNYRNSYELKDMEKIYRQYYDASKAETSGATNNKNAKNLDNMSVDVKRSYLLSWWENNSGFHKFRDHSRELVNDIQVIYNNILEHPEFYSEKANYDFKIVNYSSTGMLSQYQINELLNGMADDDDIEAEETTTTTAQTNNQNTANDEESGLTEEEKNALLKGFDFENGTFKDEYPEPELKLSKEQYEALKPKLVKDLTYEEQNAVGYYGNIYEPVPKLKLSEEQFKILYKETPSSNLTVEEEHAVDYYADIYVKGQTEDKNLETAQSNNKEPMNIDNMNDNDKRNYLLAWWENNPDLHEFREPTDDLIWDIETVYALTQMLEMDANYNFEFKKSSNQLTEEEIKTPAATTAKTDNQNNKNTTPKINDQSAKVWEDWLIDLGRLKTKWGPEDKDFLEKNGYVYNPETKTYQDSVYNNVNLETGEQFNSNPEWKINNGYFPIPGTGAYFNPVYKEFFYPIGRTFISHNKEFAEAHGYNILPDGALFNSKTQVYLNPRTGNFINIKTKEKYLNTNKPELLFDSKTGKYIDLITEDIVEHDNQARDWNKIDEDWLKENGFEQFNHSSDYYNSETKEAINLESKVSWFYTDENLKNAGFVLEPDTGEYFNEKTSHAISLETGTPMIGDEIIPMSESMKISPDHTNTLNPIFINASDTNSEESNTNEQAKTNKLPEMTTKEWDDIIYALDAAQNGTHKGVKEWNKESFEHLLGNFGLGFAAADKSYWRKLPEKTQNFDPEQTLRERYRFSISVDYQNGKVTATEIPIELDKTNAKTSTSTKTSKTIPKDDITEPHTPSLDDEIILLDDDIYEPLSQTDDQTNYENYRKKIKEINKRNMANGEKFKKVNPNMTGRDVDRAAENLADLNIMYDDGRGEAIPVDEYFRTHENERFAGLEEGNNFTKKSYLNLDDFDEEKLDNSNDRSSGRGRSNNSNRTRQNLNNQNDDIEFLEFDEQAIDEDFEEYEKERRNTGRREPDNNQGRRQNQANQNERRSNSSRQNYIETNPWIEEMLNLGYSQNLSDGSFFHSETGLELSPRKVKQLQDRNQVFDAIANEYYSLDERDINSRRENRQDHDDQEFNPNQNQRRYSRLNPDFFTATTAARRAQYNTEHATDNQNARENFENIKNQRDNDYRFAKRGLNSDGTEIYLNSSYEAHEQRKKNEAVELAEFQYETVLASLENSTQVVKIKADMENKMKDLEIEKDTNKRKLKQTKIIVFGLAALITLGIALNSAKALVSSWLGLKAKTADLDLLANQVANEQLGKSATQDGYSINVGNNSYVNVGDNSYINGGGETDEENDKNSAANNKPTAAPTPAASKNSSSSSSSSGSSTGGSNSGGSNSSGSNSGGNSGGSNTKAEPTPTKAAPTPTNAAPVPTPEQEKEEASSEWPDTLDGKQGEIFPVSGLTFFMSSKGTVYLVEDGQLKDLKANTGLTQADGKKYYQKWKNGETITIDTSANELPEDEDEKSSGGGTPPPSWPHYVNGLQGQRFTYSGLSFFKSADGPIYLYEDEQLKDISDAAMTQEDGENLYLKWQQQQKTNNGEKGIGD